MTAPTVTAPAERIGRYGRHQRDPVDMASSSDAIAPEQPSPEPGEGHFSEPSSSPPAVEEPGPPSNRQGEEAEANEPPLTAAELPLTASEPALQLGQAVRLRHGVPYLRSAEPMPMLRPPDLVDREEVGQVQELRGLAQVAVRFRRGCFLLDAADLVAISES